MKLLLVTLSTCLALHSTRSQAGPFSQVGPVSNGAMNGDGGGLCPKGFEAISQNLDGAGKVWSQPHPLATRTKDDCAAICAARSGCTSFEFAEGKSEHGACGTYTGANANIQGDENRLSANSNWRSCLWKPNLSCTSTQSTLSSNGFKYHKTKLKNDITKMEVVQKISKSSCIQGFSFGFKGPEAWVDKGCRAKFRFSFCQSEIGMPLEDMQHLLEITTNLTRVQRAEIQVLQRQQQHYMELNKEKNYQLTAKDAIIDLHVAENAKLSTILKETHAFCNLRSVSSELETEQNEVYNPGTTTQPPPTKRPTRQPPQPSIRSTQPSVSPSNRLTRPNTCPWTTPTKQANMMQCGDKSYCDVSKEGWNCCIGHQGRDKCPPGWLMCAEKKCAGNKHHCCETHVVTCNNYGGLRTCDAHSITTSPTMLENNLDFNEPPQDVFGNWKWF